MQLCLWCAAGKFEVVLLQYFNVRESSKLQQCGTGALGFGLQFFYQKMFSKVTICLVLFEMRLCNQWPSLRYGVQPSCRQASAMRSSCKFMPTTPRVGHTCSMGVVSFQWAWVRPDAHQSAPHCRCTSAMTISCSAQAASADWECHLSYHVHGHWKL